MADKFLAAVSLGKNHQRLIDDYNRRQVALGGLTPEWRQWAIEGAKRTCVTIIDAAYIASRCETTEQAERLLQDESLRRWEDVCLRSL